MTACNPFPGERAYLRLACFTFTLSQARQRETVAPGRAVERVNQL
jgi:hypothetical protein